MATTTPLSMLRINYLTQSQYDTALASGQINSDELYFISLGDGEGRGYLLLSGGNVTGKVNFGDTVTIDELVVGDLVVNGSLTVGNNSITYGTTDLTPGTSELATGTLYVVYT